MILDRFSLPGKAAIVTGAGRGIGAATAVALAEAGADVVISARSAGQLGEVAAKVEAVGHKAVAISADLSQLDAIPQLADRAVEAFGRIDIVVNNVGGTEPRPLLDTSPGFLERAFRFNVETAHVLIRAATPHLLRSGDGAVVNISSAMARLAGRGMTAYGTAKAALSHYTRLAATDLAPRIRVNAIAVGSVATSALDVVMGDDAIRTEMEQATSLGRLGEPDDIAAAVVFLASPAASYITGKVLEVDGGLERVSVDLRLPDLAPEPGD